MALPYVQLFDASPRAQGLKHGRELQARVAHNVGLYFERFAREVGLDKPAVLEIAGRYADAIKTQNADYYAAMEGVAEGAGIPFLEIAALNVRYEILYYQFGKIALAAAAEAARESAESPGDGCTAFALLPEATASGHLTMGQNWDWIPEVQGAVIHTRDADGWETPGYTESGIVGTKIGLNTSGIGLAINGMTTVADDWARLAKPFHVRCYEILRSRDFDSAVGVITNEARSCSTNFLLAQAPNRVVDVEAAPDKIGLLECDGGCLTHANHFVDPAGLGVEEAPNVRRVFSRNRSARLRELLTARLPATVDGIADALRDTQDDPFGICRHRDLLDVPENHYTTVTAVIMDLETRTLNLTDGAPDEASFQTFALA